MLRHRATTYWSTGAMIAILMVALFQACSGGPPSSNDAPKVATTIFPLYDITRNVAGDTLEVMEILPPGASPHTYALSPRQVRELRGVKVVFGIGHGLDDWTHGLVDTLPSVRTVVVDSGISLIGTDSPGMHEDENGHGGSSHHGHEGANPHYWLSITNGKLIARNIAEELIRLDPGKEAVYRTNLRSYLAELDVAKTRIEASMSGLSTRKMITFHDAWAYFAEEYGLEIVGTYEPFAGKQPTPRYLAALQRRAREDGVKALFSEPQLSDETISAFVEDVGLKLYTLDPLGGTEGRRSFIELLHYNGDIIARALSNE